MANDRHAPRPAQQPLPRQSTHVGHVRVVDRKPEDPAGEKVGQETERGRGRIVLEVEPRKRPLTGGAALPLDLSAPEYVLLLVHVDGEVLVLALLDGVGPGGDGPHLLELTADGKVSERGRLEREHTTGKYTTTLAVLPCSKHSCRSSLSVFVALKGLKKRKKETNFHKLVQTETFSIQFELKSQQGL